MTLPSPSWLLAGLLLVLGAACADSKGQDVVPQLDVLQVLPASKRVEVGDTFQIGAQHVNGKTAENVTAQAALRSDNEAIVSVTAAEGGGMAEAVGAGTAHIIAEYAGKRGTAEIVVEPPVSSLELELGDVVVANGTSKALGAVLIAGDSKRAFDKGSWGSADPAIASVDAKGVVTGHSLGETVITLTRAGLTATQRVQVQAWTLQSVELQASFGVKVLAATSGTLRVSGTFAGSAQPMVEDVSTLFDVALAADSKLLMLDGLEVTAGDKAGMLTVVATGKAGSIAAGMQAQLDIEVVDPARLQALSIQVPEQLALTMDDSEFKVFGDYDGATLETKPTKLTVDPASTVFIDLNGKKISPLELGDVMLTATVTVTDAQMKSHDVMGMATVSVVDMPLSGLSVASTAAAVAAGQSLQLTATAQYGSLSQVVTQPALWKSSDPQVAVVSNVHAGQVSALAAGTTTLSASYRGQTASFALNVAAP